MSRVLLLLPTTTYRTQAFMQAARWLGVDVTVASEAPSTLADLNPIGLLTLDFNDPQAAAGCAVEFASRHPIDAVVAVDDQVTVVAAAICQALRLPCNSVDSAAAARNKYCMRQLLERAGVPQPGFKLCSFDDDVADSARQVSYPCVVKPLSLAASRGVIRANDEVGFIRAVERLRAIVAAESVGRGQLRHGSQHTSSQSLYLAEEFIPGPEVALEGLLRRGKLCVLALFDKPDPLEGPYFEETIFVTPSRLPAAVQNDIARCTERACQALGLSEGPIHAELRVSTGATHDPRTTHSSPLTTPSPSGPWIIEVNPRSIGGLCSRVLRFGTGLSLEELIIRQALDPDFTPPRRERNAAGVMMIPIPRAGVFTAVLGLPEAKSVPGVEQVVISAHPGQELIPLPEGSLYLGFIFAHGDVPEAVEVALRASHARLEFQIQPRAT